MKISTNTIYIEKYNFYRNTSAKYKSNILGINLLRNIIQMHVFHIWGGIRNLIVKGDNKNIMDKITTSMRHAYTFNGILNG